MLDIHDLHVRYTRRGGLFQKSHHVDAVQGVSFSIAPGQTFGLVGESGSGKSTIARAILRLVTPHAGRVSFHGQDVHALSGQDLLRYRAQVQVIFQDPYTALNPAFPVRAIVGEMLTRHRGIQPGKDRNDRVMLLLQQVGLSHHYLDRLPGELSGGQRQRVAIARALAVEPQVLVCDEPTSALDVSVQSQVINLLQKIQARTGIAYLFISHDLALVRHISDTIGVMYRGEMIEKGEAEQVYTRPAQAYTRRLLDAVLLPDLAH